MSFFTGFGVSSVIYLLLNYFFPVPGRPGNFEEVDVSDERPGVGGDQDSDSSLEGVVVEKESAQVKYAPA